MSQLCFYSPPLFRYRFCFQIRLQISCWFWLQFWSCSSFCYIFFFCFVFYFSTANSVFIFSFLLISHHAWNVKNVFRLSSSLHLEVFRDDYKYSILLSFSETGGLEDSIKHPHLRQNKYGEAEIYNPQAHIVQHVEEKLTWAVEVRMQPELPLQPMCTDCDLSNQY